MLKDTDVWLEGTRNKAKIKIKAENKLHNQENKGLGKTVKREGREE